MDDCHFAYKPKIPQSKEVINERADGWVSLNLTCIFVAHRFLRTYPPKDSRFLCYGWINEWMDGCMHAWMDECMHGWMNEWMNKCMHEWMN